MDLLSLKAVTTLNLIQFLICQFFSCFSLSRFCPLLMVDDDNVNDFTFLEDEASKQKKTET